MVVPEDFTLTGAYSLSTITELEKKRRTDNLTGIRRQLHDHAKSVIALLQLEVNNPEVAEQITQSVSSALILLQTIKQFVPVLSTIDVNKYRRLVRAFNVWQNRDTYRPRPKRFFPQWLRRQKMLRRDPSCNYLLKIHPS